MAEVDDLSVTDASNTGRFPENQNPSTVNNGARALEGMLSRFFKDTVQPTKTSGGSANAQTLTPNRTIATLASPMSFLWKAGFTNSAAMTLNVSDTALTGAKNVMVYDGTGTLSNPGAGAVVAGNYYWTIYDGTQHVLMNPTATVNAVVAGTFALTGSISPTALGTDQNDYAPTSLSTASVIRQDLSAAVNITGLTGGSSGRVLVIRNINATYNITLKDASTSSTAANRFAFGRDVVIQPGQAAVLRYDGTTSRWVGLALPDLAPTLTSGFVATAVNDGTKSSGTYTPTPIGGNFRKIVNGGAFTLAAPGATGDYTMVIQITNNGSAGAITLSGFSKSTGDSFTTTNGDDFFFYITKVNGFIHSNTVALQ